jgi:hypothetical protein
MMRKAVALLVAVVALGGAVSFGSLHLDSHGNYPACRNAPDLVLLSPCAPASRGDWQFLIAVAIAAVGLGAAVGVMKRTQET